jgi:hypothetical protein
MTPMGNAALPSLCAWAVVERDGPCPFICGRSRLHAFAKGNLPSTDEPSATLEIRSGPFSCPYHKRLHLIDRRLAEVERNRVARNKRGLPLHSREDRVAEGGRAVGEGIELDSERTHDAEKHVRQARLTVVPIRPVT